MYKPIEAVVLLLQSIFFKCSMGKKMVEVIPWSCRKTCISTLLLGGLSKGIKGNQGGQKSKHLLFIAI